MTKSTFPAAPKLAVCLQAAALFSDEVSITYKGNYVHLRAVCPSHPNRVFASRHNIHLIAENPLPPACRLKSDDALKVASNEDAVIALMLGWSQQLFDFLAGERQPDEQEQ